KGLGPGAPGSTSRARGGSRASSAAPTRWRRSRPPWRGCSTARGGGSAAWGGLGVGRGASAPRGPDGGGRRAGGVDAAHSVEHGARTPFLPVLELLRDFFGLTEQDGDEAARRKIAGTLLLLDQALTDALPLVFDFLGVADPADPSPRMEPEARQRRLFALLKRGAQVRSRREPALLLWEGLPWI